MKSGTGYYIESVMMMIVDERMYFDGAASLLSNGLIWSGLVL